MGRFFIQVVVPLVLFAVGILYLWETNWRQFSWKWIRLWRKRKERRL